MRDFFYEGGPLTSKISDALALETSETSGTIALQDLQDLRERLLTCTLVGESPEAAVRDLRDLRDSGRILANQGQHSRNSW